MDNKTVVDFDYNGMVSSSRLSGEAKLLICEDGLILDGLFDRVPIAYADMNSIVLENYVVKINTGDETIVISQLGQACEWFYRDLTDTFNKKVLVSFHVAGPRYWSRRALRLRSFAGCKICVYPDCIASWRQT